MSPRTPKAGRGWPVALAAVLLVLLGGSLVAALINSREIEGSIPGKAAILGLAVAPQGFLIGTADGALFSSDGTAWSRVDGFTGTTLVANGNLGALVLNGGRILESADLEAFADRGAAVDAAVSLAGNSGGDVFLATGNGRFFLGGFGGEPMELAAQGGPQDVISLAVAETSPTLLAGGLTSGLWRSEDGGLAWTRLLGTPTRSALLDNRTSGRGFIATAGGVLTSRDGRQWSFTDLRESVEALAQSPNAYYAITASRLLYKSSDGLTWKAQVLTK